MNPLEVRYYDGKTSRAQTAALWLDEAAVLHLRLADDQRYYGLAEVRISERLGNTPRSFDFPDGGRAETTDNRAVDQMLATQGGAGGGWLHRLESRYGYVLAALVLTLGLGWGLIHFGLPWLAERVAYAMPPGLDRRISEQSLGLMDEAFLSPSRLSPAERRRLTDRFERLVGGVDDRHDFVLLFRRSPLIGANAFALPSGMLVLTDELVALAANDEELMAVLAHEIGHVVRRHGLRRVLQDSSVVLVVAAATGDVGTAGGLAALIPVMLVESKYSRDFEREADLFAHGLMRRHGIPLRAFADLLQRLATSHGESDGEAGFFSSHPAPAERARLFNVP